MMRTTVLTFCILVLSSSITEIKSQEVNRTGRPLDDTGRSIGSRQCECGISKVEDKVEEADGRIIDGQPVRPHYKYPWMVKVRNGPRGGDCGGALISPNVVLTAAHCVLTAGKIQKRLDNGMCLIEKVRQPCFVPAGKVTAGFLGKSPTSQKFVPVRKIIPHPDYDHSNQENDLALLQLQITVTCSRYVRPICLPDHDIPVPKPGSIATISGWGLTETGKASEELMESRSVIQKQSDCLKRRGRRIETHLCTKGHPGGTCKGDSGGPLTASVKGKYYVFGVVSFGSPPPCPPGSLQYFTNVTQSMRWIKQNMR